LGFRPRAEVNPLRAKTGIEKLSAGINGTNAPQKALPRAGVGPRGDRSKAASEAPDGRA